MIWKNTISTIFRSKIQVSIPVPQVIWKAKMNTNEEQIEERITKNQINDEVNEIKKEESNEALANQEAKEFAKLFQNWSQSQMNSSQWDGNVTVIKTDPDGWQNVAEKIWRNDPCPCWSGKKYKKCCSV